MGLYIDTPTPNQETADAFAKNHVIISKKDLRRVRSLARKLGFLDELKALNIHVHPLQTR